MHQSVLGLNKVNLEEYLFSTTVEIESRCSIGRTPLFWAASSSNIAAMATLLKFGARLDHTDPKGQNILHRAALSRDVELLKLLLIHIATEGDPGDNLVQRLLSKEDLYGWTPLFYAVIHVKFDHVKVLLDHGALTETGAENQMAPPLIGAIQAGPHAFSIIELLLIYGAKTNVKDSAFKNTVLHMAATQCTASVFQLLGNYNNSLVNIHDLNSDGLTPLQTFDTERLLYQKEDKPTFQENRDTFVHLLDRIEQWNMEHGGKGKEETSGLAECEVLETASIDSGDDEFFEAASIPAEMPEKAG